jgi:hypothetical protein
MIEKTRAQQIVIDLPTEESATWIRAVLQTVIKNDNYETIQVVDRTAFIHRNLSEIATQTVNITDPVTGANVTLSGIGVALAVTAFVRDWILSDKGGVVNNHGDIVKEYNG